MDTTILALDVEAEADKLVEILSTTEGMRSVWTSNCDVADGKARFGFAMAPVDLDCTVEVVDSMRVRYTIESGFPFWNGSVFEWESARAPSRERYRPSSATVASRRATPKPTWPSPARPGR